MNINKVAKILKHLDDYSLSSIKKEVNKELLRRKNVKRQAAKDILNTLGLSKTAVISRRQELVDFIIECDWQHLFTSKNKHSKYYVYLHLKMIQDFYHPTKYLSCIRNMPFYIGKGVDKRAWKFKGRSHAHSKLIAQNKKSGFTEKDFVFIYKSNLTEIEALELEAKLIFLFGLRNISLDTIFGGPLVFGIKSKGVLINQQYEPIPNEYQKEAV